jgi:hypothetical protein
VVDPLPSVPPPELVSRPPGGGIGLIALGSAVASAAATFLPVALAKWQLERTPAVHDGAVAAPVVGLGCLLAAAVPTLFLVTLATGFKALRTDEYQLGRASLAVLVGLVLYGALQLSAPKPAVAKREGPTEAECAMRAKSGNPCPPDALPDPPPIRAFDPSSPKPNSRDTLRPYKER